MSDDQDFTATLVADESTENSTVEVTADPTVSPAGNDAQVKFDAVTDEAATPTQTEAAKPAGPTDEEIAAAVAKFQAVLTEAVGGTEEDFAANTDAGGEREPKSGVLSDGLKDRVQSAFADLPRGSTKASARPLAKALVEAKLLEAMDTGNMPLARSLFTVQQECLVVRGASTEQTLTRTPVDPTEAFVNEVVAYSLAPYALAPGTEVKEDWTKRAEDLINELHPQVQVYVGYVDALGKWETSGEGDNEPDEAKKPAEPEVNQLVKDAVRISRGGVKRRAARKTSGSTTGTGAARAAYTGSKRSVGNHISEAFENEPVGKWKSITEISKFASKEYDGVTVSQGAISARIYAAGGCTIPGVQPQLSADGKKGAVKVAV